MISTTDWALLNGETAGATSFEPTIERQYSVFYWTGICGGVVEVQQAENEGGVELTS
jgi:hypothetical protein